MFTDIETFFKDIVTFYEHKLQDTKDRCQREITRVKADPALKLMEKANLANFF